MKKGISYVVSIQDVQEKFEDGIIDEGTKDNLFKLLKRYGKRR